MPLRTQNLTISACVRGVVAMTIDFDAQGNIRYSENKAGNLQNLSCIAKRIAVPCIKFKMQENSESLGSMK